MWSIIALSSHLPLYTAGRLDYIDGAATQRVNGKRGLRVAHSSLPSLEKYLLPLCERRKHHSPDSSFKVQITIVWTSCECDFKRREGWISGETKWPCDWTVWGKKEPLAVQVRHCSYEKAHNTFNNWAERERERERDWDPGVTLFSFSYLSSITCLHSWCL